MEEDEEGLKMQDTEYVIAKEEDLPILEAFLSQESIDQAFVKPLSQRPQSIEDRVRGKFASGRWLFASDENGSLVGCLALIPKEEQEEVEISTFAVSQEMRGQGIGSKLIAAAEEEMRKSYPSYKKLILDSWEGNEAIERLMEKHGFSFKNSYPDPEKRPEGIKTVIYEKNL